MTSRLREAFDDLATEAPSPPDLAAEVWRAGRLRRVRRRLGLSALVVALAAGALLIVPRALDTGRPPPIASDGSVGVSSYPQRVGYERLPAPLPDRPGPMSLTFYNNFFGDGLNLAVTPEGRQWRLSPGLNVLSPDGVELLTTQSRTGPNRRVVVHDLVTGSQKVFADIGLSGNDNGDRVRYRIDESAPAYWAADQRMVLVSAGERPRVRQHRPMVLDLATGDLRVVGSGAAAGFRSPDEAVTVDLVGSGQSARISATVTDLASGAVRELRLQLSRPWAGDPDVDLSASVSPDGSTLLVVEDPEDGLAEATLRLFSLQDGVESAQRTVSPWDSGCPTAWLGEDPVLPTKTDGKPAGSVLVTADGSRNLIAVHPRLQSYCVQWAADALNGTHAWYLFGAWPYLWTWYWWQLLLALAVPVLGLALLWLWRWRRRRRRG